MLCILYHLLEVSPTSNRPLCIMNKPLLLNPTVDAFNALHDSNAVFNSLSNTVVHVLWEHTALAENAPLINSKPPTVHHYRVSILSLAKSPLEPTLAFVCVNGRCWPTGPCGSSSYCRTSQLNWNFWSSVFGRCVRRWGGGLVALIWMTVACCNLGLAISGMPVPWSALPVLLQDGALDLGRSAESIEAVSFT